MSSEPGDFGYTLATELYKRVQRLAARLGQGGQNGLVERSRRLNQQILCHLLGSDEASSADETSLGLETLRRLLQRDDLKKMASQGDKSTRYAYERFVAEWLVLSVGPLNPFRSSSSIPASDREPEAGASVLVSAIRDRCSKLELAESMVPAAIYIVRDDAVIIASEQRRRGRLNDTRVTAQRLMAIARRLVREYPESALSYRVLCEAHDQIKKIAFDTHDDPLRDQALALAVEAAQRSLDLDPDRLETQHCVEKLTKQLASIKADRSAPSTSPP